MMQSGIRSSGWVWGLLSLVVWCSEIPAAEVALREVATKLAQPVAMTTARDGSGRLFIILQGGQIVIFDGKRVLPTPFLDLRDRVSSGGERGLLSLAFHPDFARNRAFFVNYTNQSGHTVIARFEVSPQTPNVASPASERLVLTVPQPYANHNGGQLQFGPDGFLYIGMGDGGSSGDPQNRAQNPHELLGKLLRIDVNRFPYRIPADNPWVNRPEGRPELWALGLRNPWRFSFDRLTGDLYIADVGQNHREEINVQPAGHPGGQNYGWRRMEGQHCFKPASGCNDGTLTLPVLEYDHRLGSAVIGGYVYRGTQVPALVGRYVYGDFGSGRVWAAQIRQGAWVNEELLATSLSISSFGEDEAGELYLIDYAGGRLLQFMPP